MSPEEFRLAAESARQWIAFRWAPWGTGLAVLMYGFDAVVWASEAPATAAMLTVLSFVAAAVFCLTGLPKLADRSWRNEPAQAHVFPNGEPYVTSFIFGFGFGGMAAGLPVAAVIYLLLR
jgi:hypothetical protein